MATNEKFKSLKIHERICLALDFYVTRVPGGWIYEYQRPQVNILELIFVPEPGFNYQNNVLN